MVFINDLEGVELEKLVAKAIYGDKVNILVEDGSVFIQHKVGLGLKAQFSPLTSDEIGMKLVHSIMSTAQYEIRPHAMGKVCVTNHRVDGNPVNLDRSGRYIRGVGGCVVEACCRASVIEKFGDDLGRLCEGGEGNAS